MAKIICLANSFKLEERCIAGIDLETEKWVRPVCDRIYPNDGRVPKFSRLIEGREAALLDILEIPLADTGNDFGFECENRSVLSGEWKYLNTVKSTDLIKYCVNFTEILHNSWKYVNPSYLQNLPFQKRRTLQLVYAVDFSVNKNSTSRGNNEWRGTIETVNGQKLSEAKLTDPIFIEKLESGYSPCSPCLVTVSLSMPYQPHDNWEGEAPCWKLIAGVIELPDLSELDLILVEMIRVGWSIKDGSSYLQKTYNKNLRQELTENEIRGFLNHLKSLNPSV
jgi:hypothetical protein